MRAESTPTPAALKLTGGFEEKQLGEVKAGEGGTAAAARPPPSPRLRVVRTASGRECPPSVCSSGRSGNQAVSTQCTIKLLAG